MKTFKQISESKYAKHKGKTHSQLHKMLKKVYDEDSYEIFYIVKTPEYQINCQWQIKLHSINGKIVFGLVGASG